MYQVIARKYRPAQFSELISQEHVRTTLENAINQQRIAHGYILSGQRGTGKTTVARIIARCLNCINGPTSHPCGECASCREIAAGSSVDVIEIDAASNRGINEMRELRENVRYRPARDRYKVFIVDEAHQITSEAFNALLKTLEEPPEWVVFILCTTEVHKIPVTIASRCQQFSFRSVDFAELIARMRWICEQEGIQADDEVLGILAHAGEGSVRDSLSALDQAIACCGSTLNGDEVRHLLGMFSLESLKEVTEALDASDPARMLEVVQELERNGRSLHHFCRELARYFRNLLVARISGKETRLIGASGPEQQRLIEIAGRFSEEDLTRYLQLTLDLYKELQVSLQPRLHLEVGLLRLVHAGRLASLEQILGSFGAGELPKSGTTPKPAATGDKLGSFHAGDISKSGTPPKPASPPEKLGSFRTGALPKANPAPEAAARPVTTEPEPFAAGSERKAAPPPPKAAVETSTPVAATAAAPAPVASDLRDKLIQTLNDQGRTFAIDNLQESSVSEANGEIVFTALPAVIKALQFQQPDLNAAAQSVFGRPMRIRLVAGDAPAGPAAAPIKRPDEDEVVERAMSDPGVRSFRDTFPDAEVRQVRNLKD